MSVLLSFISFLLVTAAGGRPHANLPSADGTIVPNSASTAIAYWQTMLPNSPMPSAILELLTPSAGDDQKLPFFGWGPNTKGDDQKLLFFGWSLNTKGELPFFGWGPNTKGDDQRPPFFGWGPNTKGDEGDDEKMRHGLQGINKKGAASSRGDDQKNPNTKGDDQKLPFFGWGTDTKGDDQKLPFFGWGHDEKMRHGLQGINKKGAASSRDGHNHVHGDLIFLEDVLIPGSTITPYIQPATSRAPLLHREVADSIPMSTKNFTDILKMFAPASLAMADDIWSTLDVCEHPHTLKGEKRACATSIESMVEFAMSVLGTHDVQTFSSDVPAEGVASRRYKVAAVRTLTESRDTMTCHGATFPYAVFYCHAVNPTRVYTVTLESEDGGAHKMEALAVCHLDTSQFDPKKMPQHVKPGDAAVCHFISRDSVLWAPAAGTQGDGQVAAAQ